MILDVDAMCNFVNEELATFIHNVITIIKIAVPIALVIFGMIDFGKGVLAGKEDEIKKGQHNFIKRLIAGAVVFFMVAIAQLVTNIIDKESNGEIWACANRIMNGYAGTDRSHEETRCNDESTKEAYDECLSHQPRAMCDSIFQEVCSIDIDNMIWTTDYTTDIEEIKKNTKGYACSPTDSAHEEMYLRALYSCSVNNKNSWDMEQCVRNFYPMCNEVETICSNPYAQIEYNKCLEEKDRQICDSIFQTTCTVNENKLLWKHNQSGKELLLQVTEDYNCDNAPQGFEEMYLRALFSCGVSTIDSTISSCIQYFEPYCSKNN